MPESAEPLPRFGPGGRPRRDRAAIVITMITTTMIATMVPMVELSMARP